MPARLLEQQHLPYALEFPTYLDAVEVDSRAYTVSVVIGALPEMDIPSSGLLLVDKRRDHLTEHVVNLEPHITGFGQLIVDRRLRVEGIRIVVAQSVDLWARLKV